MIKCNQKLAQTLYELYAGKEDQLSPQLKAILDFGIVEEEGCWFLRKNRAAIKNTISEMGDHVGLECFVNETQIDVEDPANLPKQGLLFVHALQKILEPLGVFNIVLGLGYTDLDDQPNFLTCAVRFHKVRRGESWLTDDLEKYDSEGLLLVTTHN